MTLTVLRRFSGGIALCGLLALVAACSGTSPSSLLSPTGPSATSRLSGDPVAFNPNPTTDPCAPTTASEDFTTNPTTTECDGRFTGGGFNINTNDVKVTRGFTLHCDALLSNNFEVNWAGGNNFHIDKNPTDVTCALINDPAPPDAPVNVIFINGTGTLNNVPGATVTLTLVDNGETAGAPADRAFIAINGVAITGGAYNDPPPIDGGNIQAHFDQPHKN